MPGNVAQRHDRRQKNMQRRLLFALPLTVAISLGVWVFTADREVNRQIADTAARKASEEVAFIEMIGRLTQQRIIRQTTENETIRERIYQRTIDGHTTPPTLGTEACNYLPTHSDPSRADVLVNKSHCVQPLDFTPVTKTAYGATLHPDAANAYARLVDAALVDGHHIVSTSSYRSYASQVSTYRYWLNYGGRDDADTYSAYPGYSEHQTGFAVDLATPGCALKCFGNNAAYQWMLEHAHEYGFVERYPDKEQKTTGYSYEPWHWRFVGVDAATEYNISGVGTLEEFWNIS